MRTILVGALLTLVAVTVSSGAIPASSPVRSSRNLPVIRTGTKTDVAIVLRTTKHADELCKPQTISSVLNDTRAYLISKGLSIGTVANSKTVLILIVDRPWDKWIAITAQAQAPNGNILWREKASDGGWGHLGKRGLLNTLNKVHHILDAHFSKIERSPATERSFQADRESPATGPKLAAKAADESMVNAPSKERRFRVKKQGGKPICVLNGPLARTAVAALSRFSTRRVVIGGPRDCIATVDLRGNPSHVLIMAFNRRGKRVYYRHASSPDAAVAGLIDAARKAKLAKRKRDYQAAMGVAALGLLSYTAVEYPWIAEGIAGGFGGSAKLMIFGGPDHRTYLGCLSCSEVTEDSVLNRVGPYGSQVSQDSIWNSVGEYGSAVSPYSACNPVASDPPVIVDENGNAYGRLTLNRASTQIGAGGRFYGWLSSKVCRYAP